MSKQRQKQQGKAENIVTSVNLPGDVLKRVDEVAAAEDRSRSFVVVRAIKRDLALGGGKAVAA